MTKMTIDHKEPNIKFWSGFIFGSLIGSFLMFTMASKEGKRVAEKLLDIGKLLEKELEENSGPLKEKGSDFLKEVKNVKNMIIDDVEIAKKNFAAKTISLTSKSVPPGKKIARKHFKKQGRPLSI